MIQKYYLMNKSVVITVVLIVIFVLIIILAVIGINNSHSGFDVVSETMNDSSVFLEDNETMNSGHQSDVDNSSASETNQDYSETAVIESNATTPDSDIGVPTDSSSSVSSSSDPNHSNTTHGPHELPIIEDE